MSLKVIIYPMHDQAPKGMDYNARVIVNGHDWGMAYGNSRIKNATSEQILEALKEDIVWEIETSKIQYTTIDWVIGEARKI
jgi:hypothetical protein